jgi:pimeloyl-ACP methyl ester carboxylesterase
VPITIIHGTRDELIPFSHAKKLSEVGGANLITIPKGLHNNLPQSEIYQETLQALLSK